MTNNNANNISSLYLVGEQGVGCREGGGKEADGAAAGEHGVQQRYILWVWQMADCREIIMNVYNI